MSTYKGEVPSDGSVDPRIVQFFEKFYTYSDDPSEAAHDDYVDSLTGDGTLIMGPKKAEGKSEILGLRKGLWTGPVKSRKHHLIKIFPFGANSKEVMIYGTVDYVLHNGKDLTIEWSAHAVFEGSEKLQMKFYQVYLDMGPVVQAAQG